jgi:SH3-like domain-containing protein
MLGGRMRRRFKYRNFQNRFIDGVWRIFRRTILYLTIALALPMPLIIASERPSSETTAQSEESIHTITVNVPVGNLRAKPTTDSKIIYKLAKGTTVTPKLVQKEWFVVQLENGLVGWAHQSLFFKEDALTDAEKLRDRIGTVPVKVLKVSVDVGRVRSRPFIGGPIRYGIYREATAAVVSTQNDWFLVKMDGDRIGWAHQSLFMEIKAEEKTAPKLPIEQPETSSQKKATLMVNTGRVREQPSLKSKIKFALVRGQTASVLDTHDDWFFITTDDGRTGWAHKSLFDESRYPPVADKVDEKTIKDIEIVLTPEGKEMVSFWLSGNNPPEIFSLTEKTPAVVCDFPNGRLARGIDRYVDVNGSLIQKVRIGTHKGTDPKIRVVIDLVPEKQYEIRPVFFKDDNLFTVIVQSGK